MKKIDTYYDYIFKIHSNIYQTAEGLKVVESINKKTTDFDFTLVFNAGSYYETQTGVPLGTAHLLEHIFFGNPNDFLKTRKEFIEYKMGNKRRAMFDANGYTTALLMQFMTHGHKNGKVRMMKYILNSVLFPVDKIGNYLEKESNIVTEEKNQRDKDEKSEWLQFHAEIFGKKYLNLYRDPLGEVETISAIKKEDLIKFYQATFQPDNSILCIQTSTALTSKDKKLIDDFSYQLKNRNGNNNLKKDKSVFKPKFAVNSFNDENSREMYISFNFFQEENCKLDNDEDYIRDRLYIFMNDLVNKVAFDFVRENLQLTYDISYSEYKYLHKTIDRYISITCSLPKLKEVLDAVNSLLDEEIEKFLLSEEGKRWFNNILSFYIYHRNISHDENYAEQIGFSILENDFNHFDFRKAQKAARTLTPQKLLEFSKEYFKIEPIIWISSPHNKNVIMAVVKKSKIYKKYNK